jgi:hypothetical protein
VFNSAGTTIGGVAAGSNLGAGSISVQSTSFTGDSKVFTFTGSGVSYTPAGSVGVTVNDYAGSETRPINAVVMMCVRY